MRAHISRWFLFGLLVGWSLTHATVFGQSADKETKPAGAVERIRQALDKPITVDFTGQSFAETLNHLRDRAGLKIKVDDQAVAGVGVNLITGAVVPEAVQVKATDEKAGHVLRKFLSPYQLCFVIIDDEILITSQDGAIMRQMRQRVSIDVADVPFKKAVRDLAKNHALNLVIDPKVLKQSDTPVSLQLDNTGIETALRLLAEMANLKAVRMGNVMFITSEEKAKKIREEELHQFENPLNPNLQPTMPVIGGGMNFNLGGIAVAPAVGLPPPPPFPAPKAEAPPIPKDAPAPPAPLPPDVPSARRPPVGSTPPPPPRRNDG